MNQHRHGPGGHRHGDGKDEAEHRGPGPHSHHDHAGHDHSAHGHAPHSHGHDHTAGASGRILGAAFALTAAFMIVEFGGGLLAKSLALVADAGHMLTDAAALALAWAAVRIASRPPDAKRSFG